MSATPSKLDRSLELFKTAFSVISSRKRLLLFPLVSLAFTLAILLFFLAPVVLLPTGLAWSNPGQVPAILNRFGIGVVTVGSNPHPVFTGWAYLWLAAIYLGSMASATFFNVAYYSEILKALRGEQVSIRAGLRFACSRIRAILLWSLFAGVVGLVIKGLEQRFGWVGRLVLRFVGMVWSVASVFVIPAMVCETEANPAALLRRSASTLRKTWGESLIGFVGITFASWILIAFSVVTLAVGIILGVFFKMPLLTAFLALSWLVAVIGFSYVLNVANNVYRGALYLFATEGSVPAPFSPDQMDGAWKHKKKA